MTLDCSVYWCKVTILIGKAKCCFALGGRHGEQIDSQTHIHAHKHPHMCVHTHTLTHTCTHTNTHRHPHKPPPHIHTHTHTHIHTPTHFHTNTHTHLHTHKHAWTYAFIQLGYITGHIRSVTTGGVGCWATCRRSCVASPCTSSFTPKTCRWLPWVITEVGTAAARDDDDDDEVLLNVLRCQLTY